MNTEFDASGRAANVVRVRVKVRLGFRLGLELGFGLGFGLGLGFRLRNGSTEWNDSAFKNAT